MTQLPVENFSGLSHASLCKSRNSKWSSSFLLLFILCCLVWPKRALGWKSEWLASGAGLRNMRYLREMKGAPSCLWIQRRDKTQTLPTRAHSLRRGKASKQFQIAEVLLYSSSALSCRQWRTKRALRGGVGKMMWLSCHIWAFQRSQGKVIFHIDGRRGEMKGGSVACNSNEVG